MKAIFFDTNFFYQKNKPTKSYFSFLNKSGFECFVPRMVIDEMKSRNRRDIDKELESLNKIASGRLSTLYFPLDDFMASLDVNSIHLESDLKVDIYFNDLFGKNIVENVSKTKMMEILLERDSCKKPPFKAEASDKGWKDTIIWTSIIRYCKENDIEEVLFVTKDGFDKQEMCMIEEFKQETGKVISFVKETPDSLFEYLKIGEDKENHDKLETNDSSDVPEIKNLVMDVKTIERIKQGIDNLMTSNVPYNSFGDFSEEPNFVLHEIIDDSKAEVFCDEMLKDKELYVFYNDVDLNKYLQSANISGYNAYNVSVSVFNDFIGCWNEIKNNFPSYKKQFLAKVADKLNSQYREEKSDSSDDLPF